MTDSCGQPLGLASEEIFDSAIMASSSDDVEKYSHFHTNARLNANLGWCAKHENKNPELTVSFKNALIIFLHVQISHWLNRIYWVFDIWKIMF